jgi:ribbon-helix-helix protein
MRKIQVFLREDQKAALQTLSARTGVRQSDLVRRSVDLLLEGAARRKSDWREATRAAAGIWRDRKEVETGKLRQAVKKRFAVVYGRG